jgi:NIPSNAP
MGEFINRLCDRAAHRCREAMMIYRIDTYDLRPRTVPVVESAFEKEYDNIGIPDELVGSFHTEFGPLNQIIQIWCFDHADDAHKFAALRLSSYMIEKMGPHLVRVETEMLALASFSPELREGSLGPYYELRTYFYPLDQWEKLESSWKRALPLRNALGSPVAGIWTSLSGAINSFTHLWPYRSLQEREHLRQKVRETGKWPPYQFDIEEGGTGYSLLSQSNKLMLPASFSRLQ